ncbi:putative sterigmatocystin biosynthesis monooxygenase-like protein [Emericellopsis cladophorae]|uniref:Sterigmatocystin biosynthesis monooxygenase-like protein n=1 Tax=Emericellopsis cladophorae TaxID=2686198 RepID=A0A9Q0BDY0_9HYPO|nr:putative sterigmatocystin biosynthesis monooxygenase-like protein [Emericellopsis cladophorae]KAI6781281.1 putative sterigmatocystin biosynthesis monooxygenase-like protein [Emericellopsis cladophorae]
MVPHAEEITPSVTNAAHAETIPENGEYLKNHVNGNSVSDFAYPPYVPANTPYRLLKQYHSKPSKLRVACIGAGASGLCLAYKMEKMLAGGSFDLTLFEKNPHFGGTWYENTYPGVACDIPSHLYTFSWDPKPDWSHYFAYGPEIQGYFESFAERHGSKKYMKLNTKVIEARWDEDKGLWNITLEDQVTKAAWQDWAHVLINGTGILNNWKWPDVEGLHDFAGAKMHSASWDHSVDFKGKTVGVIGTGSTSVQIVPQLQKEADKLKVFMRSSTWISPPFGGGVLESDLRKGEPDDQPGQRQYTFTEEDKKKFAEDPEYHLNFRKRIEAEINSLFGMYQQNSDMSNAFRKLITEEMHRRMGPGHEELKKFIIPKWSPGCRRISPGDGYLEALVQPNVEPVFGGIKKMVPEGIVGEDGTLHKMDILVCATGFNVAFKPAFKLINGDGKTINEDWGESINLYMGVSAPRFPNYYTIVGPGATWSSGTLLPSIETTVEYSVKMMRKIQQDQIRSIAVKQEALNDLYAHFDEFHKTTVFQEECRSWFKDGKQKNRIYLWPGPTIHFLKSIKDPRFEDYEIRWRYGNRFAFLGHGEVKANQTKDVLGLSTYVRNGDSEWGVE